MVKNFLLPIKYKIPIYMFKNTVLNFRQLIKFTPCNAINEKKMFMPFQPFFY